MTAREELLLTPEYEAVTFTEVEVETLTVLIVKLAEVFPLATVTLEGTEATEELELESVTTTPPVPAAAVSVTLPVAELPPVTEVGLIETELRAADAAAGFTVSAAVLLTPEKDPVRVTELVLETVLVVTEKVAEVEPAGTMTLDGTVAAEVFELDRLTVMPPVPAAVVRVTVPVAEVPPVTEVGLTEMALRAAVTGAGFTVSPAVLLTPE